MSERKSKTEIEVGHVEVRLSEEENRVTALRNAIQEGADGGIANNFDPQKHLETLNSNKHQMKSRI